MQFSPNPNSQISPNPQPYRVVVAVGGGIAAYKVCEVVSTLFKSGVEVKVILTNSAQKFVTPLTFSTLSRNSAYTDENFWQSSQPRPLHIELGEWADIILIAPLTANTLGKLVHGIADNLLTNTILASRCPVLLAPAMNTDMWEQASVQRNWELLLTDTRYHSTGISSGLLACDRVGQGRMTEPSEIVTHIQSLFHTKGDRALTGKRILISAGGTREFLDPVRFIGNPSTGKMGLALAQAAQHRGGNVTLVHAPINSNIPHNIKSIHCTTAEEMRQAMIEELWNQDVIIMSAAVADVKPRNYSKEKLAKKELPETLPLAPVPDILAALASRKQTHQQLIGFAAQTGDIITPAMEKLQRKNLDAIVANPIDQPDSGFGYDYNQAVILDKQGNRFDIPHCSKLQMAHQIFDFVLKSGAL
ncbi:bifunctional phosphopantothenoylcysteine decarboxylase/phosphopantothenate--cysteine ligase CoaBC [Calothrix sp. PCC 6303]|uniref:bifunctional phosphopantothenoylcysteine decarboxylase/phosphopantothenate--cysteine ligase CoaBC n=1 Tax=Calothrix sp. PCC 6303 TaxID=1170562 RepID=UPI0002A0102B|nr:bifunctional phosphopantothenoylcysteine decarboxylase/phosphopantothenate--cysteine ligase CoaBC [Calothrix sp. PCC 6303]AFY99829.1 phosphopantothenoylcysteine decarboxylase/phosphopantothenate/cysteine ligase [Calothrix sp. PCC 6303]